MTTHITKTWMENGKLITKVFKEEDIYKPEPLTEEQINQLRKTAPQRPWVGLTHEDIDKAIEDNQRFGGFRKVGFAYDLEAILKEKNI